MKKRMGVLVTAGLVVSLMLSGCGGNAAKKETAAQTETAVSAESGVSEDQAAADAAAALIDAIYVQERTDTTDADCAAAKAAWDALTDAQKELVEGQNADPDYFGRDTGDASLDDPRNQDEIGENEILVVSFGTSFNDSRVQDIKAVEDAIAAANPDWSVRRAFTAQIIINHIQAREDEHIDNMEQALERAVANGVKNLVIQPTHLMQGYEYQDVVDVVSTYADQFESVKIAMPLLGEVGSDVSALNEDKAIVASAITDAAVADAGYENIDAASEDGTAFVFMGHGTSHTAKVTYSQMQTQMAELGYKNVFIGTVEGEPEETACEAVIETIKEAGYKKVILRPLMVVAGDHANNDMAGEDEDSWLSMFNASGAFDSVDVQIAGLGSIEAVQQLYIAHTEAAMNGPAILADGVYEATFTTDSKMFHINEAYNDKGTLTVENGKMMMHITLPSKNVVNLYRGSAEDAQKEGAELLQPTVDTVDYGDGTEPEEVYGYDIEVPVIGAEFDLALVGTKGTWYDHKVMVSDPVAAE